MVAAGIFLSRIAGFVRQRAMAHFFGNSDAADAYTYALRIPNLLQNLFGEGVLSASFIPVYARLLEKKEDAEARRVASAVASILVLTTTLLVTAGMLAAPLLVRAFAPGFAGDKRDATVLLVRILFPGTGILVMSAWCLGVLNSHRRFLLSYSAPVLWNAAIIGALLWEGRTLTGFPLATAAAWGAVAGSVLQFGVQVPVVLALLRGFAPNVGRGSEHVREVFRNFVPVVFGRGVVQFSSYLDGVIASFLSTGAMAGLGYAQMLYLLPVSLFGMAVSASELPEMSRAIGDDAAIASALRTRLDAGLRRIAFLVVPSAVAFLALGDQVVGLVYRTGRFGENDALYVWAILAGMAPGLLAATLGRLCASAFYALRDTRTPLRIAIMRVTAGTVLGAGAAFFVTPALGLEARWGAVGLAGASSVAAWLEFLLLRGRLGRRVGKTGPAPRFVMGLMAAAGIAAAAGWGVRVVLPTTIHPILEAGIVLGAFGQVYLGLTALAGVPECRDVLLKVLRRFRR